MRKDPAKSGRGGPVVAVLVEHGQSLFEVASVCEVFGHTPPPGVGNWYRLVVCSARPGPVRPVGQLGVRVGEGLDALRRADTIVVPPINGEPPAPSLLPALQREHRRGARIVSICTGAFVLAKAGLLDGRRATTHWGSSAQLQACYPRVQVDRDVLYVDDGDVMTSAGSAAGIDLCLHIVRTDFGAEVANALARDLVVPPHRDGGQAQFVEMPVPEPTTTDGFADSLEWARGHLDEVLSVDRLAGRAAMSPRSFARRFRAATGETPHRWVTRQRVTLARRLLEATDLSVDEIALRCGLGTAANLRLRFAEVVQASPSAYRRTFHTAG